MILAMNRKTKWIIFFISSAIVALPSSYLFAVFCVGDSSPEFSKWFWITYVITIPIYVFIVACNEYYKIDAKDVTTSYHRDSLFDLDLSKDKHDIEDYRSIHEDRRHRAKYRGPHELRERVGRGEMAAN